MSRMPVKHWTPDEVAALAQDANVSALVVAAFVLVNRYNRGAKAGRADYIASIPCSELQPLTDALDAILKGAAPDPIVTRPNGKSYVFVNELTDDERRYLIRCRVLSPEQWEQLREFAAHLAAKAEQQRAAPAVEECRECDGCGWVEGGRTLKTTCAKCNGAGTVPALAGRATEGGA